LCSDVNDLKEMRDDINTLRSSVEFMSEIYENVKIHGKKIEAHGSRISDVEKRLAILEKQSKTPQQMESISKHSEGNLVGEETTWMTSPIAKQIIISNVPKINGENINRLTDQILMKLDIINREGYEGYEETRRIAIKTRSGHEKALIRVTFNNIKDKMEAIISSKRIKPTVKYLELSENSDIMMENENDIAMDDNTLEEKVYINENVTEHTRYILNKAIKIRNESNGKTNGITSAWTFNNIVYVKRQGKDRPIKIFDSSQLNDF
jgi:BMFP domain-containing protein YqiC